MTMLQNLGLYKFRVVFYNLLMVEFRKRYHGSYLGIFWVLIGPMLMIAGLSLVFPYIVKFKQEGYVLYLVSGILSWQFMNASLSNSAASIIFKQQLINKVYLPKYLFPTVSVTVELANYLIALAALHVVLALFTKTSLHTNIPYLLTSIAITYVFTLGIGYLVSMITVYVRDVRNVIGVFMQSAFYVTPIIYPIALVPEKFHYLFEFNPFFHFIRLFHVSIYDPAAMQPGYFVSALVVSLAVFVFGALIQVKYDRYMVFKIN